MSFKKSDIAIQVEKEHECIKRDMRLLEETFAQGEQAEEFAEWRLEYMWRLRDFRLHLLKHFDLEEEGGFMQEILERAPEVHGKLRQLEMEHEKIVTDLDAILSALKTMAFRNESKLEGIRSQVLQLLSDIRTHEAAENELIQTIYCQEYGYPA
ncbi:MAG: hypothetical protein ACE5IY_20840 [bacterium]